MRVLIAPDCFTGTLTATQAAEALGEGWRAAAPHDDVRLLPLSDGGPGFLDVLAAAIGGEVVLTTVSDPLGRPVPAAILLVDEEDGGEEGGVEAEGGTDGGDRGTGARPRRTAYVESAQSAGLHLLAADERNPALTSTWGVGELLDLAVREGATRVVVGLGGSATNDAGAGLLAALGAGPADRLARGGLALADVEIGDLDGLRATRERFSGIEIVLASDVDNPLLGFDGASAVHAARKGATPALAQELEAALGAFTDVVGRALGDDRPGGAFGTDLLTGMPRRPDRVPGAGAAGGLGYGLLLLGGHRRSGVEVVLEAVSFADRLRASDLVVTGEGCFDWQSLRGKVVAGVAAAALETAVPSVVVAGQVMVGRREAMGLGVSGCYAVAETPEQVEAAMTDPVGTLRARAARVAATWSPRR